MSIMDQVEEAVSCKQAIYTMAGVIATLSLTIVAMAKIGWNHVLEDMKIARDRSAVLDVAAAAALKKKGGQSP